MYVFDRLCVLLIFGKCEKLVKCDSQTHTHFGTLTIRPDAYLQPQKHTIVKVLCGISWPVQRTQGNVEEK